MSRQETDCHEDVFSVEGHLQLRVKAALGHLAATVLRGSVVFNHAVLLILDDSIFSDTMNTIAELGFDGRGFVELEAVGIWQCKILV